MSKGLYRDVTQSLGWKGTRSGIKLPAQLVDRRKRMKSDNNLIHVSRIVKLHWCSVKTLKPSGHCCLPKRAGDEGRECKIWAESTDTETRHLVG